MLKVNCHKRVPIYLLEIRYPRLAWW